MTTKYVVLALSVVLAGAVNLWFPEGSDDRLIVATTVPALVEDTPVASVTVTVEVVPEKKFKSMLLSVAAVPPVVKPTARSLLVS